MANPMLKRTLFSNRSLSIESFMYLSGPAIKNDVYDFQLHPILMFRYNPPKGEFIQDTKFLSFKMTPRNHWKVLSFINTMAKWMVELKDLFMYNDDNELIFNYDYKDLKEAIKSNFTEAQVMKAAPAVLTYNETKVPGVCLYINKESQMCQLTEDEVTQVFSVIREFSFQDEALLLSQMYIAQMHGNLPRYYDNKPTPNW